MTQLTTFPDLETLPTVSSTAMLYFSATMGTLTEVDLVTSGSFQTEFYAENLGNSPGTIEGTTSGNLSINVPTGAIPVTIPSVTESFDASAYDGTVDYGGTSGKDFAPVTSSSTPQTMVLTSPADLAAFTGHFRLPVSVSGHATGSATSDDGDLSSGFNTQTSATITVIYHYIPNLPSLDPPPATGPGSPATGSGSPATGSGSPATGSGSPATGPGSPSSSPPSSVSVTGSSGNPPSSNSGGTNAGPMAPTQANTAVQSNPSSSNSGGTNDGLMAPTQANTAVQTQLTRHRAHATGARKPDQMVTEIALHKRGQALSGGHSRSTPAGDSLVVKDHRVHDD